MSAFSLGGLQPELDQVVAAVRDRTLGSRYLREITPPRLAQACASYLERGGKHLRAALVVWSCRLFSGPEDWALSAGAAVEVFHAWTLVHDDIIDRDPVRRGGPAVHAAGQAAALQAGFTPDQAAQYGLTLGILAGDLQHGWAVSLLSDLPAEPGAALLARLEGPVLRDVIGGELLDVELTARPLDAVSEGELLEVIVRKSAALFAWSGWAGAMLAGADDAAREALELFGRHAGTAFQLRDDVLGLVGDAGAMGKPVGGDLREGKRTIPLVTAWTRADRERRQVIAAALRPAATGAELAAATQAITELGGLQAAEKLAAKHFDQALANLRVLPAGGGRDRLEQLAYALVKRDR